MSGLERFELADWRRLALRGPDRKAFLHGLVTSDVRALEPGRELPSCLLTPKGKLQAHFWCYDRGEELLLACPGATAAALKAALEKVILLSESALEDRGAGLWWSSAAGELPFSALGAGGSLNASPPQGRTLSADEFEARRIARGWPLFGVDLDADTIPLEARLESAISYTKGCYMGQETISRIHHLGHVNRILVRLKFDGPAPQAPAPLLHDGTEVGRLTSARGDAGLGTVRAERSAPGTVLSAAGRSAKIVDF